MSKNRLLPFILLSIILIGLTVICKIFLSVDDTWKGFTPVYAIGLFSGLIIKRKDAFFLLPLLSIFISDIVIQVLYMNGLFEYQGYYSGQWVNYLILATIPPLIGWIVKGRSYVSLAVGALAAPTFFYMVSNFIVWVRNSEAVFPKTFAGLMACYEAAIPFYRNALFATLVVLPVILLLYNFMVKRKTSLVVS